MFTTLPFLQRHSCRKTKIPLDGIETVSGVQRPSGCSPIGCGKTKIPLDGIETQPPVAPSYECIYTILCRKKQKSRSTGLKLVLKFFFSFWICAGIEKVEKQKSRSTGLKPILFSCRVGMSIITLTHCGKTKIPLRRGVCTAERHRRQARQFQKRKLQILQNRVPMQE